MKGGGVKKYNKKERKEKWHGNLALSGKQLQKEI